MFQRIVPHLRLSYSIDAQLIAMGNTTWQTKNVTSVRVEHLKLVVGIPAPFFKQEAPKRKFYLGWLLFAVAASWTWSLSFERPALVGIPATIGACIAIFVFAHYFRTNRLNLWNLAREKSAQQEGIWHGLMEKPVAVFSLVFQSSSGESVALTAFNQSSVSTVHSLILAAMRSIETAPVQGAIEAIEPNVNDLEKLYEKFCLEEVASA